MSELLMLDLGPNRFNILVTERLEDYSVVDNSTKKTETCISANVGQPWRSGVVVSALASISEVDLRRTRLVLIWVTVSGSVLGAGHLFQYVTNQPSKANSAFHPSGVGN